MRSYLVKFLIWRIKHISDRNFILMLASIIGALSGLAAVILKQSAHWIELFLTQGFDVKYANYLYLSFPLVGILLTYWIAKYILKDRLGHGITSILYDISKGSSKIKPIRTISRMITAAITVGFGGSVGLEAPIVVTGSAIGSNIGQLVHMNYKKRTILIGCGSAAAIAGIFNSPIAGVLFAVEVLLTEITVATFIPILIAAVFGSLVSLMLIDEGVLFSFRLTDTFVAGDVPFYVLLGITTGLFSVYFIRISFKIEALILRIRKDSLRAVLGGLILGLILFVFPPIYGEGYNTLNILLGVTDGNILNNSLFFENIDNLAFVALFMLGVLFIKPIASAVTTSAGGSGGIFAPSLFVGGIVGFVFATAANTLLGVDLSVTSFVMVGMCGTMSGILFAPLTAIFLIAEITGGYTLFIPLMLVSAISFSSANYFEKFSFYSKHLVEQGDLIHHDRDRQLLSLMKISKLIERDLLQILPTATLGELVVLVRKSKRNIFPVVDEEDRLVGVVTLDDIREMMFDDEARETILINTIMHAPPANVSSHENMQSVMHKFEVSGAWNLPVIDEGKYVGFVSKSRIFNSYRTKLKRAQKE